MFYYFTELMSRIDKMKAMKSGYDSDVIPSDGDKSDSDNG